MDLMQVAVPTAVAVPGMSVLTLFQACIEANVPGLPYRDASGQIVGKASMRHILKETCIPQFMVRHARLLGDNLEPLRVPDEKAQRMLAMTIDEFVLPDVAMVTPTSPVAKAIAVMESHDTTYLFLIDKEGIYHGTVSIMGLAKCILEQFG
jgi:hypothetical protein